jgi:hypothetical protein
MSVLSFFLFFFCKIREQEGRTGPVGEEEWCRGGGWVGALVPVGGGRMWGKGVGG